MKNKNMDIIIEIRNHCLRIMDVLERFVGEHEMFIKDELSFNYVAIDLLKICEYSDNLIVIFKWYTKEQFSWDEIQDLRYMCIYAEMDKMRICKTAINMVPSLLKFCNKAIAGRVKGGA
ncbi:MAG: hypothetical protein LBS29_04370 [Endomicrobium sp.]|jgi:hypothetical protein|nr:hypothetical protein [Endomicrobium sp.]